MCAQYCCKLEIGYKLSGSSRAMNNKQKKGTIHESEQLIVEVALKLAELKEA